MTIPTVQHSFSIAQFEKLHRLLQQFPRSIDAPAQIWTEADFSTQGDRFVVVLSSVFCALLIGTVDSAATASSATAYEVSLQFEFEAIAAFLRRLSVDESLVSTVLHNNSRVQAEFTRQLIETLDRSTSLLDRIMQQLRDQMDLPTILQTSIESIQSELSVDRVMLYQFHGASSDPSRLPGGIVAYEARSSSQVPSVLHLLEVCSVLEHPQRLDRFLQGEVLAVADVEQRYAAAPCLLQFLRQVQVRAKLVAPIVVRRQLWGLLIAHDCQQSRSWSPVDCIDLRKSSEYLAVAIAQTAIVPTPSLEEALIAAESASRAKSEFLANISHELRTPLTTVIGMSATLLRWSIGELNARQRQYLQTIHDSGDHLLQLINDILDLSQLEAGRAVLTLSDFSLTHLAQQTLQLVQEDAIASKVTLKLDSTVNPQWDSFRADPRRVQQILLNLLSNAIKFTPAGGRVTLRLFADDRMVVVQVQDTGIGIAEPQKAMLFYKFQQLDSSYQRQYTGAGVGLALTKQLVELHGGSIAVESTLGIGSVFTVQLPRAIQVETPEHNMPAAGRIVLLEADEETAELICDLLTAAQYQVIWLLDGASAIEQIEILQPIVVITVERAAGIEGDRLLATLKQNPMTKSIKVIVLTDQNSPSNLAADLRVSKPIAPDQLLQSVIRLTTAAQLA